MSSASTPTPAHAASAKKIANYTQSISTGVTNLLTEIGRINAPAAPFPAPATGTDVAILLQLQALTGQIVGLVDRMDDVQRMVKGLEKRLDDMAPSPAEFNWELKRPQYLPGAERHNELARLHNSRARSAYSLLIPLYNSRGFPVLGFPSNLGQLAYLDERVRKRLCKEFGLENETPMALNEFIGVGQHATQHVLVYCPPPEALLLERSIRTSDREAACQAAGPPTVTTREAAESHNTKARAHNKAIRSGSIMPIHDSRNIPVTGFPATMAELTNIAYQADVLYFLTEYRQDPGTQNCIKRWFEFTGVDAERALDNLFIEAFTWLD